MKQRLIFVIFLVLIWTIFSQAQTVQSKNENSNLTAKQWREDLRFLVVEMPKFHKKLFHTITSEQFINAVKKLEKQIPKLSRNQIIVEIARITAMVNDGHTRMGLIPNRISADEKIGFRQLPLKLYLYQDGLFVQSANQENAIAIGGRVVKIGNATVDEAYKKVREITFRDNEMTVKDRAPYFLTVPEVLNGLGLISDTEKVSFVVEKDGKNITLDLKPIVKDSDIEWIDARDSAKNPNPLWLKNPKDYLWLRNAKDIYWFEYLPDKRTVYLQFNAVRNKPDESFADFCKRLFAFIEANPVDKLVIDLRRNGGGSSELNWSLIYGLIRSDKINQFGKLFTIVGRRTFSAAMNCADALERHTKTIFVGEPTGSTPNHYGDADSIILPNSGIYIDVSTLFHQESGARDRREWISPQIAADLTSKDYQENIDPALQAIFNYVPEKKLSETMMEAFKAGNTKLAIKHYQDYKKNPFHKYADTENEINNLGYKLLEMNQLPEAIEVFKLNVEAYPQSWNVYDSLGAAYLRNNEKELAIKNYQKTLMLNPKNASAIQVLKTAKAN